MAKVQKDLLMSRSCSESQAPSQSEVHECVIACSCKFKKNGGAGVS